MDATQMISDSILESDEEENEAIENRSQRPLAKLCVLRNEYIPETQLPLFLGDNVLGRDPNTCALPLPAPSISKQHATICISVYRRRGRHSEVDMEALVWDLGSMNGTRKGRLKLTPNVRYNLSDGDSLTVADIPCQYVSCAVNKVSSQGDLKSPVCRNLGVKAMLPDASREKGDETNAESKKCDNGGAKAGVSLTKTPVRTTCLSLEQTPNQPQGTLVPESDSDSENERWRGGPRGRKAPVSDSDSHKSSPSCSTFLSPTNKTVPESEDESPITPSSATKNRSYKDVCRLQLTKKQGFEIVNDSEEEERVTPEERECDKNGQHLPAKQGGVVGDTAEDEFIVCTPDASTHAIPTFNMDSDTDVEKEEEGVASGHVPLNTNQVSQPPNQDEFHMDSDTDIDEDEDALEKVPTDSTKPPHVVSVIQPEGISVDSDTDVDDDVAVPVDATKAKPTSFQATHTADSAPSTQLKDFNLDSDTDVDDEVEGECGKNISISKTDASHTSLDIKSVGPESTADAPRSVHLDSDTDDEAIPATSDCPAVFATTESCTTADAVAELDILPDSDTDVEDDSPLVIPVDITTLSTSPASMSEALQSDLDADTHLDEHRVPPFGDKDSPADLRVDSDTKVENKEADLPVTDEVQIPGLCREQTPGLPLPLLQNCSTPVQISEEVEHMETQAFMSPSSVPFRRVLAPAVALSSCSDSQEDEDVFVAETQCFVVQTGGCQGNKPDDHIMDTVQAFDLEHSGEEKDEQSRNEGSFQLGLSDSSYLQCQAQALAMESTQAFVPVDRSMNLEDTQAYAVNLNADRTSAENAPHLEATQAYGGDEEPARCSVMLQKEDQEDLALEATQAYILEPHSDSEDETDKDERKNDTGNTQPLGFPASSSLAMAETQPMSAFKEEESLSVEQVKSRTQNETEEEEESMDISQPQQRPSNEVLFIAETQPMHTCDDDEESVEHSEFSAVETHPVDTVENVESDEDSVPGPRKRKAKPLQIEEEQTQPLSNSEFSVVETQHIDVAETQPMSTSGNEESDNDDLVLGLQIKSMQVEEDKTQTLTNSELSAVETQPNDTLGDGKNDEEDSILAYRKRRAKSLQHCKETQPLIISEVCGVDAQPVGVCEDEESNDEDSIPGSHKRKVKPLQLEEEQTQPLSGSEVSAAENQPIGMVDDEGSSDDESVPGPRKRRPKALQLEETQSLTNSEVSALEIPSLEAKTGIQPEAGTSGVTVSNTIGTQQILKCEEQQGKRKTRGKKKALPAKRGKPRSVEDEGDEEEEVGQPQKAREKKSVGQQKNNKEEKQLETEVNEHTKNNSILKEKAERSLVEKDADNLKHQAREKTEKQNGKRDEGEREQEKMERQHREEEQEKLERERNEKEEQEQLQGEHAERTRLEEERAEKDRGEQEEKESYDCIQEEKMERERKDNEEKDSLNNEMAERKANEKLKRGEKEKEEKERQKQERSVRSKTEKGELEERLMRERKEQENQARLERDEREKMEKAKEAKEKQIKELQENQVKVPTRGRRASRRTVVTELEQGSTISTNDDVPARRTRSRSNSSNSVSSERSATSINIQDSRGGGRGRGAKRTSEPPQTPITRGSNRRTLAAVTSQQDGSPQGRCSRSNSFNSLNSETSSCSVSSQIRGRGGRQRGRGRKTEVEQDFSASASSKSDQKSPPKPAARGQRSRKKEGSLNEVFQEDKEKADSQKAITTRGQQQASSNDSEPAAAFKDNPSTQEGSHVESPRPKRNVRGREQKAVKNETVEALGAPAVSDGGEARGKKTGRKRELTENEQDSVSTSKIFKANERVLTEAAEENRKDQSKTEDPVQAKRRGRASSVQAKKNAKDSPPKDETKEESEEMEVETDKNTSASSTSQDANVSSQPQTPTTKVSRKRQTPVNFSPVAKTPRSSSASPAVSGRVRAASQAYKVLFTGVVDEAGERVLARLGGSKAKGVADMNCLVTDKVRRTLKFLCAMAKGIPIVTTAWLEESGIAGSFLPPSNFVVKDPEQENKFSFSLQESLKIASSQPLLQGYKIHVTKSVQPVPVQMKDIIICSGATFLPKMPSSHKPHTVVITCEEDWPLCGPAVSASLPVVSAEFILTGILQQKLDLQTHTLSAPAATLQPTGGRGRKKI